MYNMFLDGGSFGEEFEFFADNHVKAGERMQYILDGLVFHGSFLPPECIAAGQSGSSNQTVIGVCHTNHRLPSKIRRWA
jgi:hypothetical protein